MKGRTVIPLVVGLAIGVFAIRSFLKVLNKAKGGSPAETVQVLRASAEVAAMTEITEEMIEKAAVPESLVLEGAFTEPEEVIGRVTMTTIPAGMLLLPSLLAPEGTLPGMASRVPEGYRAVAVQVDEIKGVGGWLTPGCHVDVVMVADVEQRGRKVGSISKTVLQNVEILAVGPKAESEGPKASVTRSVTMLVKPDDATRLALAASKGKLRLTMRNRTDRSTLKIVTLTDKDLLEDKPSRQGPSAAGEQQTLLGRLFGKQRKIDQKQTDKQEASTPVAVTPVPVQVAVAGPPEWVVDVLSGTEAYQIRFDSDGKNARQTGNRPRGSGGLTAAASVLGSQSGAGSGGIAGRRADRGPTSSDKDEQEEDRDDREPRE